MFLNVSFFVCHRKKEKKKEEKEKQGEEKDCLHISAGYLSVIGDTTLEHSVFTESPGPVLWSPVFLSGLLRRKNTDALISLSNGLELEEHENMLAFDYAIKMLEAPLSVPEGFSRCQPVSLWS